MRIKFEKNRQREFIDEVIKNSRCPSLRELSRRLLVNYSSLKNYYTERRLFSKEFFENLCLVGKISSIKFRFNEVEDNFGQVNGGKISKR